MAEPQDPVMEERVLALASSADDPNLHRAALAAAGLTCSLRDDLSELCAELTLGAGALLVTDDALAGEENCLADALQRQPPWSDISTVLIAGPGAKSPAAAWGFTESGNVTILERPVRAITLVSALRAAIRGRRRQYELRDRLDAQALFVAVVESSQDAII